MEFCSDLGDVDFGDSRARGDSRAGDCCEGVSCCKAVDVGMVIASCDIEGTGVEAGVSDGVSEDGTEVGNVKGSLFLAKETADSDLMTGKCNGGNWS